MTLPLRIAIRFLLSGKLQTVLIIGGIAVAVSVQVFVGLLLDSLQAGLVERTVGNSPQITISSTGENVTIGRWRETVTLAESLESAGSVGVSVTGNGLVNRGDTSAPVIVRGFDEVAADVIYNIAAEMTEGSMIESTSDILIGTDLAEELEVGVGDRLQVRTSAGVTGDYVIAGLFDFGVGAIDGSWVVTGLRTAQNLFGFGDRVTSIEMKVPDVFIANVVAADLESLLDDDDVSVSNWQEENEDLLNAIQSQDISSNMIQIVIIISVAIAIASILSISVLQKKRQIGILKAMGIKDRAASLIFVYQGLLIGAFAGLAGIGLGLGLLYAFTAFATTGGESVVAFRLEPLFVLRSFAVAIVASGLAGLIPAWRSLQLTPVEVIREG